LIEFLDRIDLTALSNDQIDFRGAGFFTGSGTAEARAVVNGAGHTQLFIDVDGDGAHDSLIFLLNFSGLTAEDLIL